MKKVKPKALITGANGTLGKELVEQLEKKGYQTIRLIRKDYDLTEKGVGEKILEEKGPVEILVNNAGVVVMGQFAEIPLEKELEMIKVNINATTELCKAYAKQMKKQGKGKILNISSIMALQNGQNIAVYSASKAYILSLSKSLNTELKRYGVTVTAMCPNVFQSNMVPDKERSLTAKTVAKNAIEGLFKEKLVVYSEFTFPIKELRAKITGKW